MKSNFVMDLSESSISQSHTPVLKYRKLPFYLQGFGHYQAGSAYFTEREGLDSFLLIYTLSGCGYLKYKNAEYMLEPNRAIVFNCRDYQFYKTHSKKPWEFKYIHFNGAAAKNYDEMINGDTLNLITMGEGTKIHERMDEVSRLTLESEALADIQICSVLMNILTEIIDCRHSSLNKRKYNQHKADMDKVIHYIHEHYSGQIKMDDLAAQVLMSKYYFIRLFKEYVGLTPYEYLIRYRINLAKSLLLDTNFSVNQISYHIGFRDCNHFIRYFKRYTGTTPANYRRYWIH